MTYTGAWKKSANYYYDPQSGRVHTAAPEHAVTDAADPIAFVYTAPLGLDYVDGMVPEYPGVEWVTQEPGRVGDMTPDSHDGGDTGPARESEQEMQLDSAARHAQDYGGSEFGNYAEPVWRLHTETFETIYRDGETPGTPTEISPVALQRGLNSLGQNNPEGFRRGHIEWFRPDRKFFEGWRTHDARPLVPNTADTISNTPPVPTRYGNPFEHLARALSTVNQTPMIRREPTPFSENITSDGSGDPDAYAFDWVVG